MNGGWRVQLWTQVLVFAIGFAVAAMCRLKPSQEQRVHPVLLWLPVHVSEPDANLRAALTCLFLNWTPSLTNQAFDVLVTLAGDSKSADSLHARIAGITAAVAASTAHISPRPRVMAHPVVLAADIYDVDEVRGRFSSYEGPNAVFYHVMTGLLDGSLRPEVSTSLTAVGAATTNPGIVVSTALPSYSFVHLIETDCCAATHGWLDVLLQPMLAKGGHLLISGSRGRGACWTGAEHGGCKLTVNRASPHAHLRDHINGNALYRLGPELRELINAARAKHGARVPFDVALHLTGAGDRAYDNPRSYSAMAVPVDTTRFSSPAYYGNPNIAFVHVPRRLRTSGLDAVVRRLDVGKVVSVVVAPAGLTAGDEALLAHLHAGLMKAGELRNAAFLAMDEAGYAVVSRLAPLRALLAGEGKLTVEASTIHTLRALAREGFTTFTLSLGSVILRPYSQHLLTLAEERPHAVSGGSAVQGPLLVPAKAAAWLETPPAGNQRQQPTPLPPDLFPPASSFTGPLWTESARANVAAVVTYDTSPTTPAALAAVGLWSPAQTGVKPFACANHAVLSADPLRLSSFASISRALALHAAFERFVRQDRIACAVLPGFKVDATGTTVPAAAVLKSNAAVVAFPSLAALQAATGGHVGQAVPFDGAQTHRDELDAALSPSFTSPLATLIDAAVAALPPVYHCAVDGRRSSRDVSMVALDRGSLDATAAAILTLTPPNSPVLLTGAWRHVGAWPGSTKIVTLADVPAPPTDPLARLVRRTPTPPSTLASSPWADVVEFAACQRAAAIHKLNGTTIPPATLDRLAVHIPPAVLAEDLTTLTRWLARPDRPADLTSAKRATLILPPTSPPITPSDFHDAVLAPALGLGVAGGAEVVTLPQPLGHKPWSAIIGETALAAMYADNPGLLPASVGWLLDGEGAGRTGATAQAYPASAEVWRAAEHAPAVRALDEAWAAAVGDKHTSTIHVPAAATPAQLARLKHFTKESRVEVFSF